MLIDGVATEDPRLIDGLVGPVVDELGWPVGRENDERDPGELGFMALGLAKGSGAEREPEARAMSRTPRRKSSSSKREDQTWLKVA